MSSTNASTVRTLVLWALYITLVSVFFAGPALGKRQGQKKSPQPPSSRTTIHRSSQIHDAPKPRKARGSYLQTKRLLTEEGTKAEDASSQGVTIPETAGKAADSFLQTEKAKKSITKAKQVVVGDSDDADGAQVASFCTEGCDSGLNGFKVGFASLKAFSDFAPVEDVTQSLADPFVELEDVFDTNHMGYDETAANRDANAEDREVSSPPVGLVEVDDSEVQQHPEDSREDTATGTRRYPVISAFLQLAVCAIVSKCIMTFYWQTNDASEQQEEEIIKTHTRVQCGAKREELGIAAQKDDADRVLALLQEGADVAARDNWGCSALHTASSCGSMRAARILVEHGASVNAVEDWEETSLHIAARLGHFEICQLLLERGANVNAVDLDGRTPLIGAAQAGHEKVSDLLMANGGGVAGMSEAELPPLLTAAVFSKMMQ